MARPQKVNQEAFYKSFRYTSENDVYLHEFLNSLDNTNRFILSVIKGSKRYRTFIVGIEDEASALLAGKLDNNYNETLST